MAADEPTKTEESAPSVGKTANDYMIPLSPSANAEWQGKEGAFVKYAQGVASGMYPTLAPQLQAGLTTKTLVDPYVQIAKSVLGPEAEPDFNDPKWAKALEGGTDPASGRQTLMPLSQWKSFLMSDPSHDFDHSEAANQKAAGFSQALNDAFGGIHRG